MNTWGTGVEPGTLYRIDQDCPTWTAVGEKNSFVIPKGSVVMYIRQATSEDNYLVFPMGNSVILHEEKLLVVYNEWLFDEVAAAR